MTIAPAYAEDAPYITPDGDADEGTRSAPAVSETGKELPAPAPGHQVLRLALIALAVVGFAILVEAVLMSGLQHKAAQARAFANFRGALARGEVPVGQRDQAKHFVRLGTPIALLDVPAAHIHEVVGEGTTAGTLTKGPGHARSTAFPGQPGTSLIMGRRAAFGGPFKRLHKLRPGAVITVTTGQGKSKYRVTGVRHPGDPIPPPPAAGEGRLTLATADGPPFAPSGVVYVDAQLEGNPYPAASRVSSQLPANERPLGTDNSPAWSLVLLLEALIVISIAAVWSWFRWGRVQTWIVFVPMLLLVSIAASGQFLRLLPNLT
jgi:LPXTG-site transpeptidase (sortase) family protein